MLKRVFLLSIPLLAYSLWQLWSISSFGHKDTGERADCAIILGAAAYHTKPSPVFEERIKHAIKLYEQGRVGKLIFTGGFGTKAAFAESEVARAYAIKAGIPQEDILLETTSLTTQENLTEAKKIMTQHGLTDSLIVSDPWHLKRACSIAADKDIQTSPSTTQTSLYKSLGAKSKFLFREFYNLHIYYLTGN